MAEPSPTEAKALAEKIRAVAERAANEEELRIGVEKALEPVLEKLGIRADARYEKRYTRTAFSGPGSADAVYGQAIIEYERPGKLGTSRGVATTRKQLERYLRGEASRSGTKSEDALRRLAGIGLDGRSIFFLRYRDRPSPDSETSEPGLTTTQLALIPEGEPVGSFSILGPYTVDENSVNELLVYLRALRRQRLSAEVLARQFGPGGGVAEEVVNAFYNRLLDALTDPTNPHPRVETLYNEWDRIFGIVYGQELVKAQRDAEELARLYGVSEFRDLKPLLFAVHTYFGLLMKLLAAELLSLQQGAILASVVEQLPGLEGVELRARLQAMEDGTWFDAQGIRNFLEGDFFGWYLAAWNGEMDAAIRGMARALAEYEPATGTLAPEATRDLLKRLYQYLIPRKLRHDLGEYYTPDWLAELVLNEVGYEGNADQRLLDPACGSGTFLVLAIRRILDFAEDGIAWRGRERDLVERITSNVVGFDLNPLAVIAARTNYLLALGRYARHLAGRDLPVYLCDSILTPKTVRPRQVPQGSPDSIPVPSSQREFWIPRELVEGGRIDGLCRLLEQCAASYTPDEFVERARRELGWANDATEVSLKTLFEKVKGLEAAGRNGLWARLIKNAFAPVFRAATAFDLVVGNPPWVNWESLADEYRDATKEMWQNYGLFSLKGHAARLGGGKKDVAMLMLYAAMDSYLADGGKLGFVITQTVFKTKGAGDGFRRFRIGEGAYLKVLSVHDLVELQPFEGAANRTSTVVLGKGKGTEYPVEYVLWQKTKPGRIPVDSTLEEVEERSKKTALSAQPVNTAEATSPWLTASPAALSAVRKVLGPSYYRAHEGANSGGANGVYWLRILEQRRDGLLVVENLHDVGKIKVKRVRALIEPDLVYPLLRGRDVDPWRAQPRAYVLIVQDPVKRVGYDESWLKVNYPHTYAYLKQFEVMLRQRSGYKKYFDPAKDAFYSMYDVGEYTFAPYKVVWRGEVAPTLIAAVCGPFDSRVVVPDQTAYFASCKTEDEAHYVCALVGCAPTRALYGAHRYKHVSMDFIRNVAIASFDSSNSGHRSLAALSRRAHELAARGKDAERQLREVEEEIDRLASELWGLTEGERRIVEEEVGR